MSTITLPANKLTVNQALSVLSGFVSTSQLSIISELCQTDEKQFFYDKLVELADIIGTMPMTYETDGQYDQAVAQLHYFIGGCDWYITERDVEPEQLQAFGKADLGYGAELGYISIVELLEVGALLDLHWQPKKLAEILFRPLPTIGGW